ncbi:MAG TPA: biopolymer transporter ExbD [Candidatus Saccharimonadales bacterium]|nr:biopolymer transporter ExbD [Candidatus Saccharimonadales bacterium]
MKIVKRRHPHPEIPLVSTADVSFLLLIFFLSTTIFATQRGISLELPRPGEPARLLPNGKTARAVVAADQSVTLDGVVLPMESLGGAVRTKLQATPDLLLVLSVDARAPYASLIAALDQVKMAGARQVSIQTVESP